MTLSSSPVSGRSFLFSNRLNQSQMTQRSHPSPSAPYDVFFSGKKRKREEDTEDSAAQDVFKPTSITPSDLEKAEIPSFEQQFEDFWQELGQISGLPATPPSVECRPADQSQAGFLQELLHFLDTPSTPQLKQTIPRQYYELMLYSMIPFPFLTEDPSRPTTAQPMIHMPTEPTASPLKSSSSAAQELNTQSAEQAPKKKKPSKR